MLTSFPEQNNPIIDQTQMSLTASNPNATQTHPMLQLWVWQTHYPLLLDWEKNRPSTHFLRSPLPIFSFHQRPIKPQNGFMWNCLAAFLFIYDFRAASKPRRPTVAFARATQEAKFTLRKEGPNNVGSPQSHPPTQREAREPLGTVPLEHALEEKPVARLFGPVWGFPLQAKPVALVAPGPRIVWSGPHTAQAFCGRGIPAGAVRSGRARGLRRAYAEHYSTR